MLWPRNPKYDKLQSYLMKNAKLNVNLTLSCLFDLLYILFQCLDFCTALFYNQTQKIYIKTGLLLLTAKYKPKQLTLDYLIIVQELITVFQEKMANFFSVTYLMYEISNKAVRKVKFVKYMLRDVTIIRQSRVFSGQWYARMVHYVHGYFQMSIHDCPHFTVVMRVMRIKLSLDKVDYVKHF